MKRLLFLHPLKHHVYHSIYGAIKANIEVQAYLGLYDNSKLLRIILRKFGKESNLKGYKYDKISEVIKTDIFTKLLFLMSKQKRTYNELFNKFFNAKSKKLILKADVIHVLQDYCNEAIRFAKENNKVVVYEQIIAFDTLIRQYLESEIKRWGFSNEYLLRNYNAEKIKYAKENLEIVDYIHVPSKFVYDSIIQEFGDKYNRKIIYFPYGVDVQNFQYSERDFDNNRTFEILCVSRATLTKGTKYLIEAMKKLSATNVHLTYIGMPVDEEDIKIVQELKALENVTYIPNVPHIKIKEYYKNSDLFILPSLIEGSSLSVYEAMATGLPCIVTTNCGSIITNMEDGIVINPCSVEEIVESIIKLKENYDIAKIIGAKARKTVEAHKWEDFSNNFQKFYEKLFS